MQNLCPCHSKKPYEKCCKPIHDGQPASNALLLMRSRYSAYAKKLADYIIKTTHPENPSYQKNQTTWKEGILIFSSQTHFKDLQIHEFIDGEKEAYVTFTAHLEQNGQDVSFTEKSYFKKVNDQWLYVNGSISNGKKA